MFTQSKRSPRSDNTMARFSTWLNGLDSLHHKVPGSQRNTSSMLACWKNFIERPSSCYSVLLVYICILNLSYFPAVTGVSTETPDPFDFDASEKRVTYYPDSLMLSHNPHAVIFYRNTKLLHLYIDLRTCTTYRTRFYHQ